MASNRKPPGRRGRRLEQAPDTTAMPTFAAFLRDEAARLEAERKAERKPDALPALGIIAPAKPPAHPMPFWIAAIPAGARRGLRMAIVVEVGDTPGWQLDFGPGDKIHYEAGMFTGAGYEVDGYVFIGVTQVVAWQ